MGRPECFVSPVGRLLVALTTTLVPPFAASELPPARPPRTRRPPATSSAPQGTRASPAALRWSLSRLQSSTARQKCFAPYLRNRPLVGDSARAGDDEDVLTDHCPRGSRSYPGICVGIAHVSPARISPRLAASVGIAEVLHMQNAPLVALSATPGAFYRVHRGADGPRRGSRCGVGVGWSERPRSGPWETLKGR